MEWGTAERLRELLAGRARSIRLRDHVWHLRVASADAFVDFYRTRFGPVVRTFAQLDEAAAQEYEAALREIALRHNRATDGTIAASFSYITAVITT